MIIFTPNLVYENNQEFIPHYQLQNFYRNHFSGGKHVAV